MTFPVASVEFCKHRHTVPFTELDKVALALVQHMSPDLLSVQAQQGHVPVVSVQCTQFQIVQV